MYAMEALYQLNYVLYSYISFYITSEALSTDLGQVLMGITHKRIICTGPALILPGGKLIHQ